MKGLFNNIWIRALSPARSLNDSKKRIKRTPEAGQPDQWLDCTAADMEAGFDHYESEDPLDGVRHPMSETADPKSAGVSSAQTEDPQHMRALELMKTKAENLEREQKYRRKQTIFGLCIMTVLLAFVCHASSIVVTNQNNFMAASQIVYQRSSEPYTLLEESVEGHRPFTADQTSPIPVWGEIQIVQTAENTKAEVWGQMESGAWICLKEGGRSLALPSSRLLVSEKNAGVETDADQDYVIYPAPYACLKSVRTLKKGSSVFVDKQVINDQRETWYQIGEDQYIQATDVLQEAVAASLQIQDRVLDLPRTSCVGVL